MDEVKKDSFNRAEPVKLPMGFIATALAVILGIILVINVFLLNSIGSGAAAPAATPPATPTAAVTAEPSPPIPKLQATALSVDCKECADPAQIISSIKELGTVNVTSESTVKLDSDEGKALAAKHNITKAPAVILTGELDKADLPPVLARRGDALVYEQQAPPFVDVASGSLKGKVDAVYILPKDCSDCYNITSLTAQLKLSNVVISSEKALIAEDENDLLSKYNITKVPTLLLSGDVGLYDFIKAVWPQFGTVEEDGTYVMRNVYPPYIDLDTGKERGKVTMTMLVDKTCPECYNPSLHSIILKGSFGMVIAEEKTVDVADDAGKAMLEKYNITKVPTVLLDGEAAVYSQLARVWNTVGTVESDGTYVFRAVHQLAGSTYKDLATGQVLNATTPEPTE
ncbi:hypothetical protein HY642_03170 [Candidatus Woesearchaeota archaeon]|nr:hypothetical protein [Candidatus Woesearchaeota archaeon]